MTGAAVLDRNTPVAVIGAGSMGAGIAQVAAQAGHPVRLLDAQAGAAEGALRRIAEDLSGAVRRGRLSEDERAAVLSRLEPVGGVEALAGCGLAVEAIVERLDAKQALFRQLEAVMGDGAVLATNTSSISITAVAQGLSHPSRAVGWHFFNPATRMKLVEIVPGLQTDPGVVEAMHALSKVWGKTPVAAPNAPGFIVNRVARPFYAEAMRLLAERVAPVADIDRLLREAGGFAMGPFQLIDLIGVDVNLAVTESVFAATGYDPRYAPSLVQQELVRAGRLGRKTGAGFYRYGDESRLGGASGDAPADTRGSADAASSPVRDRAVSRTEAVRVAVSGDAGLLAPLVERLRRAGVSCEDDGSVAAEGIAIATDTDRFDLMLTDGRTAAQRGHAIGRPVALLDAALDFGKTPVVGATGTPSQLAALSQLMSAAGIEVMPLADVAGLVVVRTVACLANEAADVMTWTDTSAADIDTAMRLGTAYPLGPLAWAEALGVTRVHDVLAHLQMHYGDARYRRSPRLAQARFGGGRFHG